MDGRRLHQCNNKPIKSQHTNFTLSIVGQICAREQKGSIDVTWPVVRIDANEATGTGRVFWLQAKWSSLAVSSRHI